MIRIKFLYIHTNRRKCANIKNSERMSNYQCWISKLCMRLVQIQFYYCTVIQTASHLRRIHARTHAHNFITADVYFIRWRHKIYCTRSNSKRFKIKHQRMFPFSQLLPSFNCLRFSYTFLVFGSKIDIIYK